ncbi:MAG TPA: acetyl-CoA carboxylase biotin carboxyl carrier protein subunit [Casimicrobiaceae bacterium]
MATTIELKTDITGSVWKVLKQPGDRVDEEEPVLIMESMKMEVPVMATEAGVVREILVKEGDTVSDGTVVARIDV